MSSLLQDVRHAVRMLVRRPGFTSVAVISLALGIGGTTAVFSVVNAVMLRPLPYRDPARLVSVGEAEPATGMIWGVTPGRYVEARRTCRSLSQMAALREGQKVRIIGSEETTQVASALVTGDFFALMGVPAQLGRALGPEDAKPGAATVAVISHGLWQRLFGGNPNVIGRTVEADRASVPVVGVMPPTFSMREGRDVWLPLELDAVGSSDYESGTLTFLGRLMPGVTLAQSNREIESLGAGRGRTVPSDDVSRTKLQGRLLQDAQQDTYRDAREMLLILLGAVGLLLAIAVANVASLQLVQVAGRMRDISIRLGLGATRGRVLRQLLTESLLLSLLGGAAGVIAAFLGRGALAAGAAKVLPRAAETSLDTTVLAFAFLVSLAAGLAFGVLVVWRLGRVDLAEYLRRGAAGSSGVSRNRWVQQILAASQAALSLTLLLAAGLLMRSLFVLGHIDLGLEPQRALVVSLGRTPLEILDRFRTLPGVAAVAAADTKPFTRGRTVLRPIRVEGTASPESSNPFDLAASVSFVTSEYFVATGMRMASGRGFDAEEGPPDSAVVVNEAFVKRFVQGMPPLGRRVKANTLAARPIVGVVRDARYDAPQMSAQPAMYLPAGPTGWDRGTHVVIRSHSDNLGFLAGQVRAIVRGYDPRIPILSIRPMEELVGESVAKERLSAFLYGTFALLALVLCLVGIYGVVSYAVTQRAREFGIRIALGALGHQVALLPLRQMMPFLGGGVLAGLFGAFVLGRLLENQLFKVKPTDPGTFLLATAFFAAAATVACWIPARRAAKVDPMVALRCE